MKKIFMYDTEGLYVVACQFVGVNECGEPQLVVMTPGEQVTSLETFMEDAEVDEMKLMVCKQSGVVSCQNYFETLSEVLECISVFRKTFKVMADVELKMSLTFGRHYNPEVPDKYKTMFDEINYPYAE